MASLEEENRLLKEANSELVQKVQYWKMTAAQRENEKLNLVKEINDLRLKISILRRTGNIQAQEMDKAMQAASERALENIVRASNDITQIIEITKTYISDRQQLNATSPRWSSIGCTPSQKKDKVNRVPPLMMGGQPIQPVVSLSRAVLNTSLRPNTSPNQNVTARAVPVHMLQDVYIPLTRVDADRQTQADGERETNNDHDSAEELGLDDSGEMNENDLNDSQGLQENEDFNASRVLNVVEEEDEAVTPQRNRSDNPLEGPSWMLDTLNTGSEGRGSRNLEPDSTTELDIKPSPLLPCKKIPHPQKSGSICGLQFTPTVRRNKRPASPPPSPPPSPKNHKSSASSNRVLKVVVAKLDQTTPRRLPDVSFDAPSPHGATVPGLIVSEDVDDVREERPPTMDLTVKVERMSRNTMGRHGTSRGSRDDGSESDSGGERRARRNRTKPDYKEKPLNKKLRR